MMNFLVSALENLRYHAYWVVDFIKGGKVKKHFREISFVLENFSSDRAEKLRKENLQNILTHASNHTRFYSKFERFGDFPVVNKYIITNSNGAFESNQHINAKTVSTSGSTGLAFKVGINRDKISRNTADSIYFGELAGFKIGWKLLYIRHWDDYLRKSRLANFFQNIEEFEVINLNDNYVSNIIGRIKKDSSKKAWLGYPSAFELICKYLDRTNSAPLKCNVRSIIAMSESVNGYTKKAMQEYFGPPLVSRYSNMENGIIAQQGLSSSNYIINWASYFVEILKVDEDSPASQGESGRIVVTDLFNYKTPLIRYDTGDIGEIDYSVTPPVLKKVEGRKADIILNTKGEIISSFIITDLIEYNGIVQAQLIQKTHNQYLLKLNVTDDFNEENDIIRDFKGYLGTDALIKIEYVEGIPLMASGKRKATINEFLK